VAQVLEDIGDECVDRKLQIAILMWRTNGYLRSAFA
jgi:hypothetical protein